MRTFFAGQMQPNKRTQRIIAGTGALVVIAVLGVAVLAASGMTSIASLAGAAVTGSTCNVPSGGTYSYATIQAAVNDAGCATINVAAGTYNEHIDINRSLTIQGAGASSTTVDGTANGTVFSIGQYGDPLWTVTLSGLTIRNGVESGRGGGGISMPYGGRLTVQDSVVANNVGFQAGGGIYFYLQIDDSNARLTVSNSTFTANSASGQGGGIFMAGASTKPELSVNNSTFSNNSVAGHGETYAPGSGGGAIAASGKTTIQNSTFTNNSSRALYLSLGTPGASVVNSTIANNNAGSMYGGAIYLDGYSLGGGALVLTNDTIANNSAGRAAIQLAQGNIYFQNNIIANNTGGNCFENSGNWTTFAHDQGNNLRWPSTDTSCYGTFGDPKLAALANNGGRTQTMMPLAGSAAIDRGACGYLNDQRGYYRPSGSTCDIGSVEVGSIGVSTPTGTPTITPTPSRTPTPAPVNGLVGYWKLDEGSGTWVNDASGQNHAGTLNNGASYIGAGLPALKFTNPFALNLVGTAHQFVGGINGINLANLSFSVASWAKRSTTSGKQWILTQGPSSIGDSSGFTDQALVLGFRDNDHFTCAFYNDDLDTPNQYLDTGQWHHWVCTFEAVTRSRRIYRDGVLVASDTSKGLYKGNDYINLGRARWDEGYLSGGLDDVRIYNRPLSAAEIQSFAAGNP